MADTGILAKPAVAGDDDDIDVFANTRQRTQASHPQTRYVIPENAPVLPSLASRGGVQLIVKDDGMTMVMFESTLPDAVHWVEYDADVDSLTFVTWRGAIFSLGIKIHRPFRKYLSKRHEIYLIEVDTEMQPVMIDVVPMVTRRIGI